ncbi:DUF397 domain-containing protein [Streptomyces sp. NPDC049555]|uniref:DUF397 domain-containing protein n=1 Tax=Streptomyces sp. NPDC049555 TaxID=3154930 RepID=UPI0034475686
MSQLEWYKSSFSTGANGSCVEVSLPPGGLLRLRESDDPAVVLTLRPSALAALLRSVKAGARLRRLP